MSTITLFRPVGPKELELIAASGWHEFPPRLPEQPIFYPVLNEDYAVQIARDWNVPESGAGFVTRFCVNAEFAARYPVKTVGAAVRALRARGASFATVHGNQAIMEAAGRGRCETQHSCPIPAPSTTPHVEWPNHTCSTTWQAARGPHRSERKPP